MFETLKEWDRSLFILLNNSGLETMDSFWLLVTKTLFWTPLFILLIYLIFKYYKKVIAQIILGYFLLAVGVSLLLMISTKFAVARLRPNHIPELSDLVRVLLQPESYSFYSGHASSSFLIASFVFLILRKHIRFIGLIFLFPLLFTLSRVYIGVHFPSDLIFGSFMGITLALLFYKACKVKIGKMC